MPTNSLIPILLMLLTDSFTCESNITEQILPTAMVTEKPTPDFKFEEVITYGDGKGVICRNLKVYHKIPNQLLCSSQSSLYSLRVPPREKRTLKIITKFLFEAEPFSANSLPTDEPRNRDQYGGESNLTYIISFAEISNTSIAVVMLDNACIYLFTEVSGGSFNQNVLTGRCNTTGTTDGLFLDATYKRPYYMIYDFMRNTLFVTDDLAIRALDLTMGLVSTYPAHRWYRGGPLYSITLSPDYSQLLIGVRAAIYRQDINSSETFGLIAGEKLAHYYGSFNGNFHYASFNHISSTVYLSDNLVLAADLGNSWIRVLNFTTEQVSSLCLGRGTSDGSMDTCEIYDSLTDMVKFRGSVFFTDGQAGKLRSLVINGIGSKSDEKDNNIDDFMKEVIVYDYYDVGDNHGEQIKHSLVLALIILMVKLIV